MDSQQRGASLVEVMVALFVLAIGLLGILAMQARAMQFNQSAHVYSQAVYLANDMAERIRTNPGNLAGYAVAAGENVVCAEGCSGAVYDLSVWKTAIESRLPAGTGAIAVVDRAVTIQVAFNDSRVEGPGTSGDMQSYTLVLEI